MTLMTFTHDLLLDPKGCEGVLQRALATSKALFCKVAFHWRRDGHVRLTTCVVVLYWWTGGHVMRCICKALSYWSYGWHVTLMMGFYWLRHLSVSICDLVLLHTEAISTPALFFYLVKIMCKYRKPITYACLPMFPLYIRYLYSTVLQLDRL